MSKIPVFPLRAHNINKEYASVPKKNASRTKKKLVKVLPVREKAVTLHSLSEMKVTDDLRRYRRIVL